MAEMKKQLFSMTVALLVLLSMTAMAASAPGNNRYDQQIQQAVSQKIQKTKQLRGIGSSVDDGIVTLTGTVGLYQDKLDATNKIRKIANVAGVRNDLVVAGANVADSELAQKLAKKLAYDRVGYSDNAFNYIEASVQDGVVTLSGAAYWAPPKDDATAIAAQMPGVKDVVNDVKVLPTSNFDDSIRRKTALAIYRDSVLSRYAMDPVRPIRIVVDNGHVTLYGSVMSKMDRDLAGIRAGSVAGAFSVENKLVVDKS
jgi:hyperosmotically inducible periplasmic protein